MGSQRGPGRDDERGLALVSALTKQARDVAAWDNDRIHGFEQKAGVLLGSAGTVLTVLLAVVTLAAGRPQGIPTWPMVVAAALLLASVITATICLMPWTTSYVSVEQLKEAWRNSANQIEGRCPDAPLRPVAAEAITLRALLEGQPAAHDQLSEGGGDGKRARKAVPGGLDSLRWAATVKAWAFRITVGSFALGVVSTGVVVLLTIKGVIQSG